MKNLVANSLKLFTLVGCVFVMFSCGGNTCQTCTKADVADEVICDDDAAFDGDVLNALYNAAITAKELEGFDCTEN